VNPSGEVRWVARYTGADGRRRSAGTFRLKREAQDALDAAYGQRQRADTVGAYAETWTSRHPRSDRTNATNEHRLSRVLDVKVEDRALRLWPLGEIRRRHATALVDHLLRNDRRAVTGVRNLLRTLSAMIEDAISDELADTNPWKGVKVRATDPRAVKRSQPVRVFSFEQMHALAAAAGPYEAMIRVLTDCGLRLGELLPLERRDLQGDMLHVRRTAHEGRVFEGTKTDHGDGAAGRIVPVPPTLLGLIRAMPARIDTALLFPTKTGCLWRERNWYRDVFHPARRAVGLDARAHELRHSYVSHLRAAGIDPADLADVSGHTVETATSRYTHPLRTSYDQIRGLLG
jgi:integrase